MLDDTWNICPGDWVECGDGQRGTVLSTLSWVDGGVIAVEVGFTWYDVFDVSTWTPKN